MVGFSAELAQAQEYPDAPPVLVEEAKKGAASIVNAAVEGRAAPADELGSVWPRLVFYTVADAVGAGTRGPTIRDVSPLRYWGESARTDKQLGATAGSSGSTTVNEEPGIPLFLSLALEHGAIEREISGTNVTLSTSPYSLIKLWEPDTQANYYRYSFWRRWGFSVTFSLNDIQSTPAGDIDAKNVSEWSVRLQVLGDRTTRSTLFAKLWDARVGPVIQRRLVELTKAIATVFDSSPELKARSRSVRERLRDEIEQYLDASQTVAAADRAERLLGIILRGLKTEVFDQIRAGALPISSEVRDSVNRSLVPTLRATHEELAEIPDLVEEIVAEVNRSTLLTLAYTNHGTVTGSDYSDLKLLFETYVAPVTVLLNAGIELYHDPEPLMNQSTVRDFGAGLTLKGSWNSFLVRPGESADLSRVTLAASARAFRLEEVDDYVAIAQVKLEIPIFTGVGLPVSLTYASRTELIDESEVRGNFGVTLDLEKLYARSRAAAR